MAVIMFVKMPALLECIEMDPNRAKLSDYIKHIKTTKE